MQNAMLTKLILLIAWIAYFAYFFKFYQEAIEFGDGETDLLIRILYITNYRLNGLLLCIFISFILIIVSFISILSFYYKNKKLLGNSDDDSYRKNYRFVRNISTVIMFFILSTYLFNQLWPVLTVVMLLSFIVVFIIWTIVRLSYEVETDEKEELLFASKAEAQEFITSNQLNLNEYYIIKNEQKEFYHIEEKVN